MLPITVVSLPTNCQLQITTRPCGLMDKALVFGTKDCRFESCQGHIALAMLPATSLLDLSLPTALGGCTSKSRSMFWRWTSPSRPWNLFHIGVILGQAALWPNG